MISIWYLIAAVLAVAPVAFWAGRAWPLERKLRAAVAAEARQSGFAVGRAAVRTQTAAVLTRVVKGDAFHGSDVPPRDEGLTELPTVDVPAAREAIDSTVVAMRGDAERLLADFDPAPQTTVVTGELVEASSLGTETAAALRRSVTARGELTGVPEEQADWESDDPYDVEPTTDDDGDWPQDEGRVASYRDRDRDSGPPAGEALAPTMTLGPATHRYPWAHLADQPASPPPSATVGVLPRGWMLRDAIRVRRIGRPSARLTAAGRELLAGLRADLDEWHGQMTDWWQSRRSAVGQHSADRLGRRSWSEVAAERRAQWQREAVAAYVRVQALTSEFSRPKWQRQLNLMQNTGRTLVPTASRGLVP